MTTTNTRRRAPRATIAKATQPIPRETMHDAIAADRAHEAVVAAVNPATAGEMAARRDDARRDATPTPLVRLVSFLNDQIVGCVDHVRAFSDSARENAYSTFRGSAASAMRAAARMHVFATCARTIKSMTDMRGEATDAELSDNAVWAVWRKAEQEIMTRAANPPRYTSAVANIMEQDEAAAYVEIREAIERFDPEYGS